MQETRTYSGDVQRKFVQELNPLRLEARLSQVHAQAISNPEVKSVYQVKIGRNDICPCGSGRKFKKCCINQVNR